MSKDKNQNNAPEQEDGQHLKDSCDYATSITKTLLSYASAGIAFVISIILTGNYNYPDWAQWVIIISLSISVFLGLYFLMNVVGHINQFKNYNVNLPRLRRITLGQMAFFFIPILILGWLTLWPPKDGNEVKQYDIKVETKKFELKQYLSKDDTVKLIYGDNELNIPH